MAALKKNYTIYYSNNLYFKC